MNRAIKLIVGILFSAILFYFFIKDVNKIQITGDSGAGHGSGAYQNKIVYVRDASSFEKGDVIRLRDDSDAESVSATIAAVILQDDQDLLVTEQPLSREYTLDQGSVVVFPRLQRAMETANYWWILPSLLFSFLALGIRAYRWKLFFPNYRQIRFNSLWVAVCIGYMANNLLPFRMGEIIRAWIFGKKENRSISQTFGTIVMERVFDILSILILFVAFIFYFGRKPDVMLPEWLMQGAWGLAVIAVLALFSLLGLRFQTDKTMRIVRLVLKPFPQKFSAGILNLFNSFIDGLSIFHSWRATFIASILSMVIWLDLAVAYYCMFLAVNIQASILISLFLIVGLAFAVSIPSAPGFIGTFHFVGKEVLLMVGISGNLEAYVLLAHAVAYVPVVIVGLIYLSLENLTFKDLTASIRPIQESTSPASGEVSI